MDKNGYNLTKGERERKFRRVTIVFILLVLGLFIGLLELASWNVSADSASWEAIMSARLTWFRLVVGAVAALGAVRAGCWLFGTIDRSHLGERLFHWRDQDSAHVKAANTTNAALILAALILGLLIIVGGALR